MATAPVRASTPTVVGKPVTPSSGSAARSTIRTGRSSPCRRRNASVTPASLTDSTIGRAAEGSSRASSADRLTQAGMFCSQNGHSALMTSSRLDSVVSRTLTGAAPPAVVLAGTTAGATTRPLLVSAVSCVT